MQEFVFPESKTNSICVYAYHQQEITITHCQNIGGSALLHTQWYKFKRLLVASASNDEINFIFIKQVVLEKQLQK